MSSSISLTLFHPFIEGPLQDGRMGPSLQTFGVAMIHALPLVTFAVIFCTCSLAVYLFHVACRLGCSAIKSAAIAKHASSKVDIQVDHQVEPLCPGALQKVSQRAASTPQRSASPPRSPPLVSPLPPVSTCLSPLSRYPAGRVRLDRSMSSPITVSHGANCDDIYDGDIPEDALPWRPTSEPGTARHHDTTITRSEARSLSRSQTTPEHAASSCTAIGLSPSLSRQLSSRQSWISLGRGRQASANFKPAAIKSLDVVQAV